MAIELVIITPQGQIFSGAVEGVTAPGVEGEFGVLAGHVPFITTLISGELSFVLGGKGQYFAISGGYIEVNEDKVKVIADSVERAEDIDKKRAELARKRAEEALKTHAPGDMAYTKAEIKLQRALTRISVASRRDRQ